MNQSQEFLITCDQNLSKQLMRWCEYIRYEKRLAEKTLEAYQRDVRQFLQHFTGYLGNPVTIEDIAKLKPVDLRGFLARRRSGAND